MQRACGREGEIVRDAAVLGLTRHLPHGLAKTVEARIDACECGAHARKAQIVFVDHYRELRMRDVERAADNRPHCGYVWQHETLAQHTAARRSTGANEENLEAGHSCIGYCTTAWELQNALWLAARSDQDHVAALEGTHRVPGHRKAFR
jgi:hypothetical protein